MRKNRFLLLLALLLTAATGAWAESKVYDSGEVDLRELAVGDILMPGVTLKKTHSYDGVDVKGSRYFRDGQIRTMGESLANYPLIIGANGVINNKYNGANYTTDYTPITAEGEVGNAWEVTYIDAPTYADMKTVTIAGIKVAEPPVKHLISVSSGNKALSMEQELDYVTTVGELYEAVTGISTAVIDNNLTLEGVSSGNPTVASVGNSFQGWSTPITVKADGEATVTLLYNMNFSSQLNFVVVTPLYVALQDGTDDFANWTAKVGDGQFKALPIGGMTGDGTETVTLKYSGDREVKSITATLLIMQSLTIAKGSSGLSGDKVLYYMPGDTYRQALARKENQSTDGLGWSFWEDSNLTTLYFKEVTDKAWDVAIDGDSNFSSGKGSCTITLDTEINPTGHTFEFVGAQ